MNLHLRRFDELKVDEKLGPANINIIEQVERRLIRKSLTN